MKSDKIKYFIGDDNVAAAYPIEPYAPIVVQFLDDLAKSLRYDLEAKMYPDVQAFAFWCRKGNISKLRTEFASKHSRIGRGLAFHIAPSNVPVNFAYSLVFGLLAGNGNIVRVSNKSFQQTEIICRCMKSILNNRCYDELKSMIQVVSYERDAEITDYFSSICDARIIWGGDETIREITKSPIAERSVEIHFADRYSFGIIDPMTILNMDQDQRRRLAEQFYNDTYLMDQNACSTPHLIVWLGNKEAANSAREMFWNAVNNAAGKYNLTDIKVSDKYTVLCEYAADGLEIADLKRFGNRLYVIELKQIHGPIHELRGKFGEFFEINLDSLEPLAPYITPKVQSCMVCGVNRELIMQFIFRNHLKGIDRIVPFGSSLDIGVIWDGYDIIGYLSRIIE